MARKNLLYRVSAASAAAVLVMGTLAGCGGSSAPAAAPAAEASGEAAQEAAAPAEDTQKEVSLVNEGVKTESGVTAAQTDVTADSILERDFSEPIKISFAGIQVTDGLDYNHGNAYYDWWTNTFNVEWDITSLTFENWVQRMNTWLNADDIPDWCVWNFNAGDAVNYVDQELVKKLPDDWKEKYPNLAAAAACTPLNAYYEQLFGGTYYLFRPAFANNFPADLITSHMSVYLRKDWAEQAGYDLSKNIESNSITISELLDYCRAVKEAGITTYPWVNTTQHLGSLIDSICENSGIAANAFYKAEDGQYHWAPAEEESGVKEAIRQVKTAYDEGLLYPEFYTLTNDDDAGYFHTAGTAAMVEEAGMAVWFDRFDSNMKSSLDTSYWDTSVTLIVTDDNGVSHQAPNTNFWACNIISPNISDEALERLLTIWDYGCTEEGQLRIRLGIPGEDWDYDENGNIVNLLADTEYGNVEGKYTTQYPITGNMFILSDDFSFVNPSFSQEARDRVTELYLDRAKIASSIGKSIDYDLLSYSSQALNQASMQYADEYANMITKDADFDATYDQWVKDKMPLIQPVLDDLNAQFGE